MVKKSSRDLDAMVKAVQPMQSQPANLHKQAPVPASDEKVLEKLTEIGETLKSISSTLTRIADTKAF